MSRPRTPFSLPPAWVADAIFYQIFPDRFASSRRVRKPGNLERWDAPPTAHGFKGGDLLGIAERLDHMEELGANAIYLNPVFSSASNHRYHAYDYHAVDPLLGGNEALLELLEKAHARGIRVVLDGVFNHCGRGFWPFHHLLENGPQSPYVDWFTVKGWPLRAYDPRRPPNYLAWWGLHALPKLNVANPETREYLLEVAERWMHFGADGWRLDVPNEIDDRSFWREFRRRVRAADPEAYLVGEIWREEPEWLEGDRFDGLMNYPLARTILGLCVRRLAARIRPGGYPVRRLSPGMALEAITRHLSAYPREFVLSQLNVLGSHDTPRFLTLARGDHSALHLATLLQMTLPGAPCIYYGDEVGLEGGKDPDCRRAFPWRRSQWHRPTWSFFKKAVALRQAHAVLRHGDFRPVLGRGGVVAFLRGNDRQAILVVLNVGVRSAEPALRIPREIGLKGPGRELWASRAPRPRLLDDASGCLRVDVTVEPRSATVLSFERR